MSENLVQESKLFSQHSQDEKWVKALRGSSMSEADANNRLNAYTSLFSRYEKLKEAYKTFSGVTEMPLLSNQYFNATVASFVRSFAGYLSIERDMAEPTALLWYDDVLGVSDDRMVLPNIGQENLNGIDSEAAFNIDIDQATETFTAAAKIVPGSLKGVVIDTDGVAYEVSDDGKGYLMGRSGLLAAPSTINYATGEIKITPDTTAGQPGAKLNGGKIKVKAIVDVPGTPAYGTVANNQKNRFKLDMKNILVASEADMLIGESNLVAMAQANKSLNQNPMQVLGAKLVELYTKVINQKLVNGIQNTNNGTDYNINAVAWNTQFYDFTSRLTAFSAELVNVDTKLAEKSVKGVEATAYVCSPGAGNWFRQMRATGEFVEEKGSSYVNDLLGYYHGIPVLRHTAIPDTAASGGDPATSTFFACVKTPGGEIAPLMFGQYLPLTWTPNIGSYSNPTQIANGVFYQNGIRGIASDLIQKVVIAHT